MQNLELQLIETDAKLKSSDTSKQQLAHQTRNQTEQLQQLQQQSQHDQSQLELRCAQLQQGKASLQALADHRKNEIEALEKQEQALDTLVQELTRKAEVLHRLSMLICMCPSSIW